MTGQKRVYEIALESGQDSKVVLEELAALGVQGKSASSTVAAGALPQLAARLKARRLLTSNPDPVKDLAMLEEPKPAGVEYGMCWCCLRNAVALASPKLPDLPTQGTARRCKSCAKHAWPDSSAGVRNREHLALYMRGAEIHRQEEIDALQEVVTELRAELETRPVRIVKRNLDQEEVDYAKAQTASALNSRDRAFQELLHIKYMHRTRSGAKCSCGLDRCPTVVYFASEAPPYLSKWEADQVKNLDDGNDCYLPDTHPARVDPRLRRNWLQD